MILGDFNVPDISWAEMDTVRSENSFDSRLLIMVTCHTLIQHAFKPTRLFSNQRFVLYLVTTYETEDIVNLNIFPPLTYTVLSFVFRASDTIYNDVKARPNVWRKNIGHPSVKYNNKSVSKY